MGFISIMPLSTTCSKFSGSARRRSGYICSILYPGSLEPYRYRIWIIPPAANRYFGVKIHELVVTGTGRDTKKT